MCLNTYTHEHMHIYSVGREPGGGVGVPIEHSRLFFSFLFFVWGGGGLRRDGMKLGSHAIFP